MATKRKKRATKAVPRHVKAAYRRVRQETVSAEEKDRLIRSFIVKFLDLASSEETVGRAMLAELKSIKAQLAQFQLWEQDGYTSNESRAIRCAKRLQELMRNPPPRKVSKP